MIFLLEKLIWIQGLNHFNFGMAYNIYFNEHYNQHKDLLKLRYFEFYVYQIKISHILRILIIRNRINYILIIIFNRMRLWSEVASVLILLAKISTLNINIKNNLN